MNMILYENRTFLIPVLKQLEKSLTAKNPVISPNFLVWKINEKAQFPHSFGRITRNYAETVLFHKISTSGD